MRPEFWAKIEEIFQSAIDRPTAARAAFVVEQCGGGDVELRREVENLINRYEPDNSFLEHPAWNDSSLFQTTVKQELVSSLENKISGDQSDESFVGQTIGAYRLIEELGRGGMGVVYLAERGEDFRQRVAVKVVKRGMDTDFVLRRFRQERQVLAVLDHPNIARLLDGGATADGRPYLVMEYIEGLPIDRYCDEQKLPVRDRLKLFQAVCAAVGYSHQRLIIHRDIKPSNILVTDDGTPKLLDFGIAKLLDETLASASYQRTATNARMMTPDYASPEQLRGETVTTVSDVYSLGVLLYFLLTGHLPFQSSGNRLDAFARMVSEQKPERPSAVITRGNRNTTKNVGGETEESSPNEVANNRATQPKRLRRYLADDLDNIVLKALRKETVRRYSSVEQLSDDIGRHLEGLPVKARGDDFIYKTRKFFQRHKSAVLAAVIVFATLIAGMAATGWQATIANRERARAEAESERAKRRFNESRRLSESLMFELHDAIRDLQGATPARELLAKRTLEHLDSLAAEAGDDRGLQGDLAIAYINLGNIQGNPYYPNLGDTNAALESYRKAEKLSEFLSSTDPANVGLRRRFWLTQIRIGDIQSVQGDLQAARETYARAASMIENLAMNNPSEEFLRGDLASSYDRQGNILMKSNDPQAALAVYEKAQTIFEQSLKTRRDDNNLLRSIAAGHGKIGGAYLKMGEVGKATESFQKLLQINESRLAKNPSNANTLDDVAGSLRVFGDARMAAKDYQAAFAAYNRQLQIYQQLTAVDSVNVKNQVELAISHSRLGVLQTRAGDAENALENQRKALAILRELEVKNSQNTFVINQLPLIYFHLADSEFVAASKKSSSAAKTKHLREALSFYEQSKTAYAALPPQSAAFPENITEISDIENRIAACNQALEKLV
jgi:non-specific serine/threonine protein kinase/serine/threonine-protein kinase